MTRRTRLVVLLAALAVLVLIVATAIAADLFAGTAAAASRAAPLVSPHLPGNADDPPPESSLAGQPEGPESVKRTPRPLGTVIPDRGRATSPSVDSESAHELRLASVAASTPAAGVPPVAGTISGVASFVGPAYGARYLALPAGRGVTVRICGPEACVLRTSTDAGPDRAMQRAGRVADLSFRDFARVCGCDPWVVGLVRVTVTPLPAPPETSTEE